MLRNEAFKKTPLRSATRLHLGNVACATVDAALYLMHDALTYASFTLVHSVSVTHTDTRSKLLKSG